MARPFSAGDCGPGRRSEYQPRPLFSPLAAFQTESEGEATRTARGGKLSRRCCSPSLRPRSRLATVCHSSSVEAMAGQDIVLSSWRGKSGSLNFVLSFCSLPIDNRDDGYVFPRGVVPPQLRRQHGHLRLATLATWLLRGRRILGGNAEGERREQLGNACEWIWKTMW